MSEILRLLIDERKKGKIKGEVNSPDEMMREIAGILILLSRVNNLKENLERVRYVKSRNINEYDQYIKRMVQEINLVSEQEESISLNKQYQYFKNGLPGVLKDKLIFNEVQSLNRAI
ncbi:hypothetical protein A0H76_2851 [Hepatospora eriocheir]|uniref:Uncharacterized protein n=1 Tax=Hepatospora eriocheir TaxID=1081669 RepID=A0A1X0Q5F9_9MICR|nr:hypothetical protein A0H76_2851 [Hepatospora eriocheir]